MSPENQLCCDQADLLTFTHMHTDGLKKNVILSLYNEGISFQAINVLIHCSFTGFNVN